VNAIADDDSTVKFDGFQEVLPPEPASRARGAEAPIRVLIVGWSSFGPKVVEELDQFLPPGSSIDVCVDAGLVDPATADAIRRKKPGPDVWFLSGGPEKLLTLAEGEPFDQIIVLGYRTGLSPSEADSRTLLTLLTLRKIWPTHATPRVRIIAQLLDQRNAELATVTGVDDFIVSDALASLMLAQLSERAELEAVFDDLFDPEGSVVELRPAHRFVPDAPVTYAEMVAAGAAQGVSVIGWRWGASGEVVLNPPKDRRVHLGREDQVLLVGLRASRDGGS
jgi:hypothetical protein